MERQPGVIWSPWESLNLGAVFKTGLTADASLQRSRVDFFQSTVDGSVVQTTNAYGRDDLTIRIPGAAGVGASWRPRSNLTISLDYTRTRWSTGQIHNFFTLPRTEPDQPPPTPKAPQRFLPVATVSDPHQGRGAAGHLAAPRGRRVRRHQESPEDGLSGRGTSPTASTSRRRQEEPPTLSRPSPSGTGLIVGPFLFDVAYLHETGSYLSIDPRATGSPPEEQREGSAASSSRSSTATRAGRDLARAAAKPLRGAPSARRRRRRGADPQRCSSARPDRRPGRRARRLPSGHSVNR